MLSQGHIIASHALRSSPARTGIVVTNAQKSLRATFLARTTYNYLADMKIKAVISSSLLFLVPLLTFVCWQILSAQTAEHPGQHAANQAQNQAAPQEQSAPATGKMPPGMNMPEMDMPGMNTGDADKSSDNHAESGAMHAMQPGHHMDGAHMRMTPIARQLPTTSLAPIRSPRRCANRSSRTATTAWRSLKATKFSCPIFPRPSITSPIIGMGFSRASPSIPRAPLPCSTRKPKAGYELVGAMYTAPRSATLEQLDERVPLGIASWHVHTNFCVPRQGQSAHADWTKFGLTGSISTPEACSEAGGKFYPQIFGWMVHVYPFETSRAKVWGQ